MLNEQSTHIVIRFFEAIQRLIDDKVIRGRKTFTTRYGINRWNFITLSREPSRNIFQVGWLENLVRDYGVNPMWLLTGQGEFYAPKNEKPATDLQVDK